MTKTAAQLNGLITATVIYIENADGTYSPASASVPIPVSASDLIVGSRDGVLVEADATLTRPANATPYAVSGGMGTAATCRFKWTNFFRKNANTGILTGSRLIASVASIATTNMGTIRLYLYTAAPSFDATLVDQGQWASLIADKATSLGYIEFSTWNIGGTGSDMITAYGVPCVNNMALKAAAAARDLYGYLIANSIFTPIASAIMVPQLSMSED